jgi:hypothetical protein
MEQGGFTATMNWVLDDLVRRVDGISQAVVLSRDGRHAEPGSRRGPPLPWR